MPDNLVTACSYAGPDATGAWSPHRERGCIAGSVACSSCSAIGALGCGERALVRSVLGALDGGTRALVGAAICALGGTRALVGATLGALCGTVTVAGDGASISVFDIGTTGSRSENLLVVWLVPPIRLRIFIS